MVKGLDSESWIHISVGNVSTIIITINLHLNITFQFQVSKFSFQNILSYLM